METFKQILLRKMKTKFKSYYVVWKHEYAEEKWNTLALFKSYYVVWKLVSVSRKR